MDRLGLGELPALPPQDQVLAILAATMLLEMPLSEVPEVQELDLLDMSTTSTMLLELEVQPVPQLVLITYGYRNDVL
jgi:hypothetical protein